MRGRLTTFARRYRLGAGAALCARRAISPWNRSRHGRTSPTYARGIDAVNSGPGVRKLAHRRDEQVEIAELERAFTALWRFVTGSV